MKISEYQGSREETRTRNVVDTRDQERVTEE